MAKRQRKITPLKEITIDPGGHFQRLTAGSRRYDSHENGNAIYRMKNIDVKAGINLHCQRGKNHTHANYSAPH